jgi:hypothetical protein
MSRFLTRDDFEHACLQTGFTDLTRDGDGYYDGHTQATYQVWLLATGAHHDQKPVGWVSVRHNKIQTFGYTRPQGPGSHGWDRRAAQGWGFPLPVFATVPALSKSAITVVMERLRQQQAEGYTAEWDAQFSKCELEHAAACYALQAAGHSDLTFNRFWPWDNPIKRRPGEESLAIAGALILAALDARADRASKGSAFDE